MVTMGVDAHTRVHHALALDDTGSVRGSWRGSNAPDSWQCLLAWADSLPGPHRVKARGTTAAA